MNVPKLIAVCGYKRCGKDTLCNYISSKYGHRHVKIAGRLKDITKILFGFSHEQLETDMKDVIDPTWGVTPRRVMQFIGTEMFQFKLQECIPNIERNFWIRALLSDIASLHSQVVISDLRFVHEYKALKEKGYTIIKIEGKCNSGDPHSSELEYQQIPPDLVIHNNETMQHMYDQFDHWINQT